MTDLIIRCKKFFVLVFSFATVMLASNVVSSADLDDLDMATINGVAVQNGYGIASDYVNWALRNVPWVYNPTNAPPGFTDDVAVVSLALKELSLTVFQFNTSMGLLDLLCGELDSIDACSLNGLVKRWEHLFADFG